jgi:hypothetical protein
MRRWWPRIPGARARTRASGRDIGRRGGGSAVSMRSTSAGCEAEGWQAQPGWRITWRGCASLAFAVRVVVTRRRLASRGHGGWLHNALLRWRPGVAAARDGPGEQGEQGDRLDGQGLGDGGRRDRFPEAAQAHREADEQGAEVAGDVADGRQPASGRSQARSGGEGESGHRVEQEQGPVGGICR